MCVSEIDDRGFVVWCVMRDECRSLEKNVDDYFLISWGGDDEILSKAKAVRLEGAYLENIYEVKSSGLMGGLEDSGAAG